MKWSSTIAALLVLASSAPLSAEVFGRYQRVAHEETTVDGPAFAAPVQSLPASVVRGHTRSELEAIEASAGMSGYNGAAKGYRGTGYGGAGMGVATGGSCCIDRNYEAEGLWGDYCMQKQACSWKHAWKHGWLAGRLGCGCGCCPPPAPARPMFCGWKHGLFAPACGCEQPAAACASAEPACPKCDSAPCGCHKAGGLLVSLFASFHRKHGCGCGDAPVCGDAPACTDYSGGQGWSQSYEGGEYYNEGNEEIEPAPPVAPMPPADDPAAAPLDTPPPKSARRGLFPEGFRLLPIFGG
jgi:hypothetical protein